MNPFTLIRDVYVASESGQQLAKPETWANRATVTAKVVVFITVVLAVVNQFTSFGENISAADIHTVAEGIVVVGMFAVDRLHTASNVSAGKVK